MQQSEGYARKGHMEKENIARMWKKYFEELLKVSDQGDTLQMKEYHAIQRLKQRESPGNIDNIPAELLKKRGDEL